MKHNTIIEGGFVGNIGGADQNQSNWSKARMSRSKRAMDIVLSLGMLIFMFPLYVLVAILIKMNDGGPALFKQRRIGVDGTEFYCYKFRTMVMDAEDQLNALLEASPEAASEWRQYKKLKKDPRITTVGRFLRKSSLDELPQLINILKGEMSVIGPRTITQAEVADYGNASDFTVYCSVRPGVLGLWQLSGRSDTGFARRVELDVEYVKEWSLWGDIKLLFVSVPVVLLGKGAY